MRKLLLSLAALLVAASVLAAEPPVAALVEAIDNPTLGPAGTISNITLKLSDRMTVTLTNGTAAPILAGKDVIGLFFSGKGSYAYRSTDPLEATNVRFAVKKASDLKLAEAGGVITLSHEFDRMMLRSGAIALPELGPSGGTALDPQFKEMREDMGRRQLQPATHMLVKQRIDAPQTPVAIAEFSGSGRPSLYLLDSLETRGESLSSFTKIREIGTREMGNYWWPMPISEQRLRGDRREFLDPPYLLTDLDYTVIGEEKEYGKITVTETIMPRGTAQSVYRFDLHSQIYDSAERPRKFNVLSVKDDKGRELSYDHTKGSLLIGLKEKVPANQPFRYTIEIEGNFLVLAGGNTAWQLGTEPWFPLPDLNGQYYTIHSTVKVKKPFIAFTPGTTIRRVTEGDYNVVETRVSRPVQFAVVHAGRYYYDEQKYDDGLTIRVASYAQSNAAAQKKLGKLAWKMIKFYEPWLGPFPFKEFNIIEINELGFGQAPPGTMFITKEAFNPLMGDDNKLFSEGVNERYAHEIAHQYWGHVVKMGTIEEQWVTESFAEYSSSLAIKKMMGPSAYNSMVAKWRSNAKDAAEVSSIALANRIRIPGDLENQFRFRAYLIYDKGAYVLAALHKELGDDKFLTFLRSLTGLFEFRFLTTRDMIALLARIDGGKDYTPFFEQYYWGTGMPKG
jgi:Peptidase family M1 domain